MQLNLFVPGRLCLFGEHTDWAGKYRTMNADIAPGASIATGIEQGIYAEVEKSPIFEMYSEAPEIKDIWQDFACRICELHVLADNVSDKTYDMITKYVPACNVERVSVGHGAGTFRVVYEKALDYNNNDLIYFLEDDYLHLPDSLECLISAAKQNYADYITLYDHPDKYGFKDNNPYVKEGGEKTKVFLTDNHHWKLTDSTTMTVAAFVDVLKRDKATWWRWTETRYPYDFQIFVDLRCFSKAHLISPIPSLSTHGETKFLAPCVNWEEV